MKYGAPPPGGVPVLGRDFIVGPGVPYDPDPRLCSYCGNPTCNGHDFVKSDAQPAATPFDRAEAACLDALERERKRIQHKQLFQERDGEWYACEPYEEHQASRLGDGKPDPQRTLVLDTDHLDAPLHRSKLFAAIGPAMARGRKQRAENERGQQSLFDLFNAA